MATLHRDFHTAMAVWQGSGGAMLYEPLDSREPEGWWVGDPEEIEEMACGANPKQCTAEAMAHGGLGQDRINALLSDWQD